MDWALTYRPCDLPGGRGRSVGQSVLRSQFAEFANVVAARRIRFPMVPGGYFHLRIDEAARAPRDLKTAVRRKRAR